MKKSGFTAQADKLLRQGASTEEKQRLESAGFNIKKPTRMTMIAFAIYEKAVKGDLSAIKELLSHTGQGTGEGGIVFIDDIKKD